MDNRIDVIATDHAPHTLAEKNKDYFNAPSGGPLVQDALLALFEKSIQGIVSKEKIVEKTAHNPSILFQIEKMGFLREGYFADIVIIDPNRKRKVEKDSILYKCGWSPFEGITFSHTIHKTFVNGNIVFSDGMIIEGSLGKRLKFNR